MFSENNVLAVKEHTVLGLSPFPRCDEQQINQSASPHMHEASNRYVGIIDRMTYFPVSCLPFSVVLHLEAVKTFRPIYGINKVKHGLYRRQGLT